MPRQVRSPSVLLASFFLVACGSRDLKPSSDGSGDGSGSSQAGSARVIASAAELPPCDAPSKGALFYLQDVAQFKV